ncbi:MAG TPA: amidohydrolase family protein [Chloroflexota bacterium]|jgi:predicted TIM-barrel fold metal-dependent hydrolase
MRVPYTVISADSHLEIAANRWRERVPIRHRDSAPKTIRLADGSDAWQRDDGTIHLINGASNLCAGKPFEERRREGARYDLSPGAGSPEQRLREQDEDGIDAEVIFPSVNGQGVIHGIRDDEAYLAVIRAYNEWVAEEYCGTAQDRLIVLGVIPQRGGVRQAIEEMEHCASLGFKGVWLGKYPNGGMRPKPEDDEFWAESLRIRMPVTAHQAFVEFGPRETSSLAPASATRGAVITGREPDLAASLCIGDGHGSLIIPSRMVIDGVFERFPDLQLYVGEAQIGWIPNMLEQMDMTWARDRHYLEREQGLTPLPMPPSQYMARQVLWGFLDNPFGVRMRHEIGVQHLMWGSDFPHAPTDWPNSLDTIARNLVDVPQDEQELLLVGNAVRFFHLETTFESTPEREAAVAARRSRSPMFNGSSAQPLAPA